MNLLEMMDWTPAMYRPPGGIASGAHATPGVASGRKRKKGTFCFSEWKSRMSPFSPLFLMAG
jgi:hypothetical protein